MSSLVASTEEISASTASEIVNDLPELSDGAEDKYDAGLEEELETLSLTGGDGNHEDSTTCVHCQATFTSPRVLPCLHVFCQTCLQSLIKDETITCPTCDQVSECENASCLAVDYVIANAIDLQGIRNEDMSCTSCKAKEKAVARCSDCANFLCPNCVTAHKFMRCFENHKVVSFDDITGLDDTNESMPIHRPITCSLHDEQSLKYFCRTCQTTICNECMMSGHRPPAHTCDRVADIEQREIGEIMDLVQTTSSRLMQCESTANTLQHSLAELQSQRDDAKSLIKETFQSYKTVLEKRMEALLTQLTQLHEQQELTVMEMFNNVNQTADMIEHSCAFAKKFLRQSNSLELLCLKKTICDRLYALNNKPLSNNMSVDIEFVSDKERFETAIEETFGHFKLRDDLAGRVNRQKIHQQLPMRSQLSVNGVDSYAQVSASLLSTAGCNPNTLQMVGSPDSDLSIGQGRPLSAGVQEFKPSFLQSHDANDQLGLRNATMSSLSNGSSGSGLCMSRQSQSPTISDSGIGMDSSGSPGNGTPGVISPPPISAGEISKRDTRLSPRGQIYMNSSAMTGMPISRMTGFDQQRRSGNGHAFSDSMDTSMHFGNNVVVGAPYMQSNNSIESILTQRRMQSQQHIPGTNQFVTPPNETCSSASGHNFNSGASQPPHAYRLYSHKMSLMHVRVKFGQLGPELRQFNAPHGFCMGVDEAIVIADTNNHRIQLYDKNGRFLFQFGIPGREEGQLWFPRKVAVFRSNGRYVICDRGNERSRMQIFSRSGHFIKKIAVRYIDIVAGLAISQQGHIVAVDSVSPTVFTVAESGDLIKWFDCSDYMREPSDIAVCDREYYVCDFKGHCVVVFNDEGQYQRRIGSDLITNFPNGIDISDAGDVLIGDSHGNRFHVAVFQRDGSLIGEFECPYVKVSRCCGLKITSEGYVVTLAKNNHHLLILDTLYIS